MSDTGAKPEVSVSVEEIAVTKSYETKEFPVPAVAFELRSERADEAMVRLIDTVPEGVPPEDLGFHPEYGSEHWSVEDGTAVFERRLGAGEQYRTVYGIRTSDHDAERFMTEPELGVRGLGTPEIDENESKVEEESNETAAVPGRDSTQAARDVISGEGGVAGLDDEDDTIENVDISGAEATDTSETTEETATADASGTTDTTDMTEPTETTKTADGSEDGREPNRHDGATTPSNGVGAALAAELRDGELSETDRDLLAEELRYEDSGSDVRIRHLQSRISDLEAYIDALEEFIDENGSARKLIEDMNSQLEGIEEDIDDLDERTTENTEGIDALEGRTDEQADDINDLDERTTENTDDIDALDKGLADAQSSIEENREAVETLQEDVAEINDWRSRISSVLGGVPDNETETKSDDA